MGLLSIVFTMTGLGVAWIMTWGASKLLWLLLFDNSSLIKFWIRRFTLLDTGTSRWLLISMLLCIESSLDIGGWRGCRHRLLLRVKQVDWVAIETRLSRAWIAGISFDNWLARFHRLWSRCHCFSGNASLLHLYSFLMRWLLWWLFLLRLLRLRS